MKYLEMQGIWGNIENGDSSKSFLIISGKHSLNVVHVFFAGSFKTYLTESIKGFQNFKDGENDSINIFSIANDGLYYTAIDKSYIRAGGWVHDGDYLTPGYFECDGELMSINGGKLIEYGKISELPFERLLFCIDRVGWRDVIICVSI